LQGVEVVSDGIVTFGSDSLVIVWKVSSQSTELLWCETVFYIANRVP